MRPEDVNPANFTHNGNIVYTSPDTFFSVAKGIWTEDGTERYAMRWNGDINDPKDKGYPTAFGNPMWFQLPQGNLTDILKALK